MTKRYVKAIIPLYRETLSLEQGADQSKSSYKSIAKELISERKIFGIAATSPLGFIPSLEVYWIDSEKTFMRDVYIFKSLEVGDVEGIYIDFENEMHCLESFIDTREDSKS